MIIGIIYWHQRRRVPVAFLGARFNSISRLRCGVIVIGACPFPTLDGLL